MRVGFITELNKLFSDFQKAGHDYEKHIGTGTSTEPACRALLKSDIPDKLKEEFPANTFHIKGSIGDGRITKCPWVAIMHKNETSSSKQGVYLVFLFSKDLKRIYLSLAQGVSKIMMKALIKNRDTLRGELKLEDSLLLHFNNQQVENNKYKAGAIYSNEWNCKDDSYCEELLSRFKEAYETYIATRPGLSGGGSATTSAATAGSSLASYPPKSPMSTIPGKSYPKNLILYGPPGTGKTYNSIRYAVSIINGYDVKSIPDNSFVVGGKSIKEYFNDYLKTGQIRFTTFHQSLSYEDFIEGIKPEFDKSAMAMTYPVKPGLFKEICEKAEKKGAKNYVLIIDEINRGNVAQIFGELITLIEEDKRKGGKNAMSVTLPYSPKGHKFSVPSNLYIIGTMNTADRSVEALDSALRRRFKFIEMMPNADIVPDVIKGIANSPRDILGKINERIEALKDSEHEIGHSYFMEVKTVEDLMGVFRFNIIPLLKEYFFGDMERIKMVIGGGFFETRSITKKTLFPDYEGDVDVPEEILQTWDDARWEACETDPGHKDFIDAIDVLLK